MRGTTAIGCRLPLGKGQKLQQDGCSYHLQESTQLGAELYNEPSAEADAEMAALMIDCLKAAGLKKFQVVVGQADFFCALAKCGFLIIYIIS